MWLEAGHWNIMITMLRGKFPNLDFRTRLASSWSRFFGKRSCHGKSPRIWLFFVFPSKCWIWTVHRIYCALGGCFGWCFCLHPTWSCPSHHALTPQLTGLPLRLVTRTMQVYQAEGARGRCKVGSKGLLEMEGILIQWLRGDTEGKSLKSLLFRGRVI